MTTDFSPQKIVIGDFPYAPGTAVQGSLYTLYTVVDRDGFAFLACCAFHERAGVASGWHPETDHGRMLGDLTSLPGAPADDCGREMTGDEARERLSAYRRGSRP